MAIITPVSTSAETSQLDITTGYVKTLDGWRAIAILAVMAFHGTPRTSPFIGITGYGWIGVDVFFALSGYLICSRLLDERDRYGRINLKAFYIRRAFRILPPVLLYLVVLGLLGTTGVLSVQPLELVSSLLFFRNYVDMTWYYTLHFWSLAIEEHFYLVWPALLSCCNSRRALRVAFSGIGVIVVWRWLEASHQWLGSLLHHGIWFLRTDVRLDGLLWGCVFALLTRSDVQKQRLRRDLTATVCSIVVSACVLFAWLNHPAFLWTVVPALIPLLVMRTVLNPNDAFSRFLEHPVLRWIGRISYSLYLWQEIFLVVAVHPPAQYWWQRWPANFVCTFLMATCSYYVLEKPMIRLGHRLATRSYCSVIYSPDRCNRSNRCAPLRESL